MGLGGPLKTHTAVLYTKEGCHLCAEARARLERLASEFSLRIEEIDITNDSSLFEKYKESIPVVVLDGEITIVSYVGESRLREAMELLERGR
ncbi:MAG: glutaredoxin family protein [Chloroflexi bacterium]|nr:glutaredoxin family protein [Chloroflexota bacterium]